MPSDEYWMQHALDLARRAQASNEVPVGAVLIHQDKIIGQGYNQSIALCDPSAHAEVIAIRSAAAHMRNHRLVKTTLYVTLEPCLMCAGVLMHARVSRLVFGTHDFKTGVICSCDNLLEKDYNHHSCEVKAGVLADECGKILRDFFKQRRKGAKRE